MRKILFLFPLLLFAENINASKSLLSQAELIQQKYNKEVAKLPPPSFEPKNFSCLNVAPVWFTIDLEKVPGEPFDTLSDEKFWETLREIGVHGIHFKGLKQGGKNRTGFGIDPKWGPHWDSLSYMIQQKGLKLIGSSIGSATGLTKDFFLALKNVQDYPGLYHLIEIEKRDWRLLPQTTCGNFAANIPWLSLQALQKRGYVPMDFQPYVKMSAWNATAEVKGADGILRRWIYLKENSVDPVMDWENPSFAAFRIASADLIDAIYNFGEKILQFEDFGLNTKQTLALWTRKLGGFSVLDPKGGIFDLQTAPTDLFIDHLTGPALMHALITEDAEGLRLMYKIFLDAGVEIDRFVHLLQPFDQFSCDWKEFIISPNKRFQYYNEMLTGEALRSRLLKNDIARLVQGKEMTWPALCTAKLENQDVDSHFTLLLKTHLLLATFYALQPGAFSFSMSDLLGSLDANQPLDPMIPNENTAYGSLPAQMKNQCSFASKLRNILVARGESDIAHAKLIDVLKTEQKGLIMLLFQHPNSLKLQLLSINFGSSKIRQVLEIPGIKGTSAIDLLSGSLEKKPLDSATIQLEIPPLSGKVILFQPKYYD